jgi:hypothetical protein
MMGTLQRKPDHHLGHDQLTGGYGVNMVPMRGTLAQAQADARSILHRRGGTSTASLSVIDCQHGYRIQEAAETLARAWTAENSEQIPMNALIFYWARSSQPSQASIMSRGACPWRGQVFGTSQHAETLA